MNITVENDVKIIRMGDKGPNLLSVDRAKQIIQELNYDDCKAVIFLGNDKVFSAGEKSLGKIVRNNFEESPKSQNIT